MAKKRATRVAKTPEHYAGLGPDQRKRAVASATSEEELDAMWQAWEETGQSREGLLYGAVLWKRQKLGGKLSRAEQDLLQKVQDRADAAKNLEPIQATLNTNPRRRN